MLINFSLYLEKTRSGKDTSANSTEQSFMAPPTLNQTVSATNSASISVNGYSMPNKTVKLYVNGDYYDSTMVKDDRTFVFKNVTLQEGENTIKAKTVDTGNNESAFSEDMVISFNNKAPTLDIDTPNDGQSFSKDDPNPVKVAGKTNSGERVTINGFWAIVDDEGKFSYMYRLQNGDNTIKIEASDDAGNKTTKEIKVKLNQ